MREVLESLAGGELSVDEAEAALRGYATSDAGRFDAAREQRRGVPEAILGDGKTPEEVSTLAVTAVETTGRALVTRATPEMVAAVERAVDSHDVSGGTDDGQDVNNGKDDGQDLSDGNDRGYDESDGNDRGYDESDVELTYDERARTVVVHAPTFEPQTVEATVTIVSGGTADAMAVGEAATVAREMGPTVTRIEDVGIAHLGRVLDHLDALREADVLVVAAGREGALPSVVAGLVDTPVVGLPVASGYGHGGNGEAALAGMLQSCTVLSVVNVNAGFVAGAQAGLIARSIGFSREC